jgi:hypothetical protein
MHRSGYIRRSRKAYLMKLPRGVTGAALALSLIGAAPAAADPSLRADPDHGEPGDDVALHGRGWTNPFCESKITLSFRQSGRKVKLGSAVSGDGRFLFNTHYQQADPGSARFVAVQPCAGDNKIKRAAYVTIGGGGADDTVNYKGQTEHGGRVSFEVVDGNEVRNFRFMNRCSKDRQRGSRVPGGMAIGDISFSRRGQEFTIFGRFRTGGLVNGSARQRVDGCDSGKMTWSARRAD